MKKLISLIKKSYLTLRNQGTKTFLRTTYNWIFIPEMRRENKLNPRMRYDNVDLLIKHTNFHRSYKYGELDKRVSSEHIIVSWIISPFHIGSGGHQTIFRFIKQLEERGFRNHLYITDGHNFGSPEEAYNMIQEHFFSIPRIKVEFLTEEDALSGVLPQDTDFLVATRYNTAYYAAQINNCRQRFYFIQDLEHQFFPVGYQSLVAENTYKLGMTGICASPWLLKQVKKYGTDGTSFYLGYDPEKYSDQQLEREPMSVAFYGRYESDRRAVQLGMTALEMLQAKYPDLKVYLYGSNDTLQGYDLNSENLGVVNYEQMSQLFNKVSVGLTFSLTNYGLTPTEMMACGLPVLELKGDNTESIFDDEENIVLAEPHPNGVADALERLLTESKMREKIATGGIQFVKDKSWDQVFQPAISFLIDQAGVAGS